MTRRARVLLVPMASERPRPVVVDVAGTTLARLRGWIGRRPVTGEGGLWLAGVRAVHTFGMRGAIDVVFVGERGRVLAVRPRVGPCRVLVGPRGTRHTVELPPGDAARLGIAPGDGLGLVAVRGRA